MPTCFFVSDLHGRRDRYETLFAAIAAERPAALFFGGDLLPHPLAGSDPAGPLPPDFLEDYLAPRFAGLRTRLGPAYPRVFLILGNDDPRAVEPAVLDLEARGLWTYAHDRHHPFGAFAVYGYSFVPPTPFTLKDWERYDLGRFVDPGCIPPEEGWRTVPADEREIQRATIREDLDRLVGDADLERAILLLHSPPYDCQLDRAALDGRMVDHVPVDVHVGSIAVHRLITARQPLVTLHGHVHESARLTGSWHDRIGRTHLYSAAHDGPELALVRFDPGAPEAATRSLL